MHITCSSLKLVSCYPIIILLILVINYLLNISVYITGYYGGDFASFSLEGIMFVYNGVLTSCHFFKNWNMRFDFYVLLILMNYWNWGVGKFRTESVDRRPAAWWWTGPTSSKQRGDPSRAGGRRGISWPRTFQNRGQHPGNLGYWQSSRGRWPC